MTHYKVSRFTHAVGMAHRGLTQTALYQTMSKAFCLVPNATWVQILKEPERIQDTEILNGLMKHGFLVSDTVNESAALGIYKQQYVHDTGTAKFRTLMTDDCNFRCGYCYIDHGKQHMRAETLRQIDAFYIRLLRKIRPKKVIDNYLGGEPLLKAGLVIASASRRRHYAMGSGIDHVWGITTNGYLLTRPLVREMCAAGISEIRVSLAGPAEVHNALRPLKGGGDTYSRILANLKASSDLIGFGVETQYRADETDYGRIPEMMDELLEAGVNVTGIEFSPIFPPRHKPWVEAGVPDPGIYPWLCSEAAKRGLKAQDEVASGSFCMADARHYYVFDSLGNILPCPALGCGELSYGNVFDGIDFIKEAQILTRNLPDRCSQACDIAPLCFGGCRLQPYHVSGSFCEVDCQYDALKAGLLVFIEARALKAFGQPTKAA